MFQIGTSLQSAEFSKVPNWNSLLPASSQSSKPEPHIICAVLKSSKLEPPFIRGVLKSSKLELPFIRGVLKSSKLERPFILGKFRKSNLSLPIVAIQTQQMFRVPNSSKTKLLILSVVFVSFPFSSDRRPKVPKSSNLELFGTFFDFSDLGF